MRFEIGDCDFVDDVEFYSSTHIKFYLIACQCCPVCSRLIEPLAVWLRLILFVDVRSTASTAGKLVRIWLQVATVINRP